MKMTSAQASNGLFGQLSQFWSMLDELSENDPAGYRKLLEAQRKEGADLRSPPRLHASLRTEALEPGRGPLYINICSWSRVPAPGDPGGPLPVCAGELETSSDEGGGYAVLDVALNPAALRGDPAGVRSLALRLARERYGLTVSRDVAVVGRSPNSGEGEIRRRLGFGWRPGAFERPVKVSQTPADLLRRISSSSSSSSSSEAGEDGGGAAERMIGGPAGSGKTGLISVVSSSEARPREPRHRLQLEAGRRVRLTVELPGVSSVSECQLTISKEDILLEVGDLYYLLLDFPAAVDEDTASAVFSKKKRTLVLTVDASDSR